LLSVTEGENAVRVGLFFKLRNDPAKSDNKNGKNTPVDKQTGQKKQKTVGRQITSNSFLEFTEYPLLRHGLQIHASL
jgi:hypothetical protein